MDEGALGGLEHYNKERKHAGYSAGGASGIFEDAGGGRYRVFRAAEMQKIEDGRDNPPVFFVSRMDGK